MSHNKNLQFLETTLANLKGKPGAGSFATVLNDYRQLLGNHQERDYLEIGKTYSFIGRFGRHDSGNIEITGKLLTIGTYTLLIENQEAQKQALIYKSALSLITEAS